MLPPVTTSVRAARAFARERCAASVLGPEGCELLVLLVSELVTNAVVHARSEARLTITDDSSADGSALRVEVGDDSPVHPQLLHPGPRAASGRGVGFVDRLATGWGVQDVPGGGKVVWFTLAAA